MRFMSLLQRILLLLVSGWLTACAAPPFARQAPAPITLKVVILPTLSFAPHFIALEEGYFAEQALTIEFVRFERGAEAIPALIAGQIDVHGGLVPFAFLNAITRGANIRLVADKGVYATDDCPSFAFVVRRSLIESGQYKGPADLKGRRVSVNPNSSRGYLLEQLLAPVGLTMQDVTLIDMAEGLYAEALERDQIDMAVAAEPFTTRIMQHGSGVAWRNADALSPGQTYGIIGYGPNLLEKNPDAGRRFMLAYLKGVRQYNQGKTERNLAILEKHTELDRAILTASCWPAVRSDGKIDVQSFADYQNWAFARKQIDQIVPADKLWDGRFVEQAMRDVK